MTQSKQIDAKFMKKLLLILLSMPTVAGVFLPLTKHATAAEVGSKPSDQLCLQEHGKMYCVRQVRPDAKRAQQAQDIARSPEAGLNFTDEESLAAIAKFGCDCPACIRAIKQIRTFTGVAS